MSRNLFSRMLALVLTLCILVGSIPYASAEVFAITQQPTDVTVAYGETASTKVIAVGDGLTYQWWYANEGSSTFSKASITKATYSVTMNEERDGRRIYCIVTDANGLSLISETVTLSMGSADSTLKITQQPNSVTVPLGETASATVQAEGEGLKYQWYYAEKGSTKFAKASIVKATYAVEMTSARAGRRIYCVITDQYGNKVTSETVTLSMGSADSTLKITQQPNSVTVPLGETASATVQAEGDGLKYQWYYAEKGSTKFAKASIVKATYAVEMTNARAGRQIYCVITDQYGNKVTSDTVTLSMGSADSTLKITQQPNSVTVPLGETASATVQAEGEGLKYQWYYAEKGSTKFAKASIVKATYAVEMTNARAGRQIYCVITDQYGNKVTSDTVTLSMGSADSTLQITQQPESVTVPLGETASVTVKAEGEGLKYQWYYAEKGSTKFAKASIVKATYAVEMTNARAGRQIYCVITDQYGNKVTSDTVTLSMGSADSTLKITQQPESVTVPLGETASVTVKAEGEGLKYQWYYAEKGSTKFAKASIVKATYAVEMTNARAGRQIYCVITDQYGNKVTSDTVTLSMGSADSTLKITQQPESVTVPLGETASVTVKAEGDGLTYQWYYAEKGSTKFAKASIVKATYAVEMTNARAGRQIYCVITDQYGNTVTSDTVTLSMGSADSTLKITQQPESVTVPLGETASVTVKAEGEGLKYQWYYAEKGSTKFAKASIVKATYAVEMTNARAGRQIYCVITDQYGNTVTSDTVTLSMGTSGSTVLQITHQPESVTVASGETASVTVKAAGDGLKYQWYYAEKGSTKFAKASIVKATYAVSMTSARNGRRIYCVVTDQYGNSVTSDTVTLSMGTAGSTALKITQQPKSVAVKSGASASVTVKAEGDGLTYQWYYADKGAAKFSKASITSATYSVTMNSTRDGRRVYCIVTDQNGNTVTSDTVTLIMAEPPVITQQPIAYSRQIGDSYYLWLNANGYGLTYEWYCAGPGETTFKKTDVTVESYLIEMKESDIGRRFYCVVTDALGTSVQSDIVTISTYPAGLSYNANHDLGYAEIHGYYGTSTTLVIPETLDGLPVMHIEDAALNGSVTNLTSITLPSTLTTIGSSAFAGQNLTSITIPGSVTTIGNNAFGYCDSLKTVILEEGITATGEAMFTGCSALTTISLPSTLTTLADRTFNESGLTSFTIPDTVTTLGDSVFARTPLTSITLPAGITSMGTDVFANCTQLTTVNFNANVSEVPENMFTGCSSLTKVTYSSNVTSIGSRAFAGGTSITSVADVTPAGLVSLGDHAFDGCTALTDATCPESLQHIGAAAFFYSSIKSFTGSANLKTVGARAFLGCDYLEEADLSASLTSLGEYAFSSCDNLYYVALPDSLTEIPVDAFISCGSLRVVNAPSALKSIGDSAFHGCSNLSNFNIPAGVTEIGEYALAGTSISSVTIPAGVTTLNNSVFYGCSKLTSIVIPENVTVIGNGAFEASGVSSVTIEGPVTSIGEDAFQGCHALQSITLPSTLTTLGEGAFSSTGLQSIIIPAGVTEISDELFYNCWNLKSVTMLGKVTSIGAAAFQSCSSMTSITLPNGLTEIGAEAFIDTNLTQLVIPNSVTSLMFPVDSDVTLYVYEDSEAHIWCDKMGHTNYVLINSPITITTQPKSVNVSAGATAAVSVTAVGQNLTYKWYAKAPGATAFTATTTTTAAYSVTMSDPVNGTWVYCQVKDANGNVVNTDEVYLGLTVPYGLAYSISNGIVTITDYTGYDTYVTVPAYIEGCKVTVIGAEAFKGDYDLQRVYLPDTLTTIGDYAFANCGAMGNITFPEGLTTIGNYAFSNCTMLYVGDLPSTLTSIGEGAFVGCNFLASFTIPDSVTSIGSGAFENCTGLTSITIPATVTTIGEDAFTHTTLYIYTDSAAHQWCIDNSYTDYVLIVPLAITAQPQSVSVKAGETATVTVAAAGSGVTYQWYQKSPGWHEFEAIVNFTDTHSVTMTDSVTGTQFYCVVSDVFGDSLTTETVTVTVSDFYYQIESDNTVTIVAYIGNETQVTIPAYLEGYPIASLDLYTFNGNTTVQKVVIPDSVTYIGDYTFNNCPSLTDVNIPASLIRIGEYAFSKTAITSVTLPASVTEIGAGAFSDCKQLASIIIPATVTTIGGHAFKSAYNHLCVYYESAAHTWCVDNGYTNYEIIDPPLTITTQPVNAVVASGETAVVTVEAAGIGVTCQWYAKAPGAAEFTATDNTTASYSVTMSDAIDGTQVYCVLTDANGATVTTNTVSLYKAAPEGLQYAIINGSLTITGYTGSATQLTIPQSIEGVPVTVIGNSAFSECSNLISITIPDSVTTIEAYAFYNCSALTSINIPESVTTINEFTFFGCSALDSVTIPESVTTIKNRAFASAGFTELDVPDSVTSIGVSAFAYCPNLTSIKLPSGMTSIPDGLLECNESLTSVTIPANVTSIGAYAFDFCTSLTAINIPGKVTTIGEYAFYHCENVTSVTIPDSVTTIDTYAFRGLPHETTVTIPKTVTTIGVGVFYGTKLLVYYDSAAHTWCIGENYYGYEIIDPPLTITAQPANVTAAIGEEATVTVEATGQNVTYQWYGMTKREDQFAAIDGANGSAYTFTMTEDLNGLALYCVVTDANGDSLMSETAVITLYIPLQILTQPSDVTVAAGAEASTGIAVDGNGISLQWYVKAPGADEFTATDNTDYFYTISEMTAEVSGTQVYCVVTDEYGDSLETVTATLTMADPITITFLTRDVFVSVGETATIAIEATGTGLTYQWYTQAAFAGEAVAIDNTTNTYTAVMTDDMTFTQVYCVVTDVYGQTATSAISSLRAYMLPVFTMQPIDIKAEDGATATTIAQAEGWDIQYLWYAKAPGETEFTATDVTDQMFTITMSEAVSGTQVYCVITDEKGATLTSDTVTLRLRVQLAIITQPVVDSGIAGSTPATATIEAVGESISYQWFAADLGSDTFLPVDGANGPTHSVWLTTTEAQQVYCHIADEDGNAIISDVVILTTVMDGMTLTVANGEATVKKLTTSVNYGSATVPAYYDNCPVTALGNNAFSDCRNLAEITLPDSIRNIGEYAFYATAITAIDLPSSLISIGEYAFCGGSALTAITIPSGVTSIPKGAFEECINLVSVTLPEQLTSIGTSAFADCDDLVSIVIPDSVTTIGAGAFMRCFSLQTIEFPALIEVIGNSMFSSCTALTSFVIPESVTAIDGYAFYGCSALTELTIPKNVATIGNYAFSATKLFVYNNSAAHQWCLDNSYTNFELIDPPLTITAQPANVTAAIGEEATVTVEATGQNVTYQWYGMTKREDQFAAIDGANGSAYTFTMTEELNGLALYCVVTDDGDSLMSETAVITLYIPLQILTQPSDVVVIEGAEASTGIAVDGNGISLQWYVKAPGADEFTATDNTDYFYTISEMTAELSGTQVYCVITDEKGATLTSNTVTLSMKEPIPEGLQYRIENTNVVTITGYTGTATELIIPDSIEGFTVTAIGESAFAENATLTSIVLPDSITKIGDSAFAWSSTLRNITLPANLKIIGEFAFAAAASVTEIDLPEGLVTIGANAFCDTGIENIVIPDSVENLGASMFSGGMLESITLPSGLTALPNGFFIDCAYLKSITLPDSLQTIGSSAFAGTGITAIELPASVTAISDMAFDGCSSLTEITIPKTVSSMGLEVFPAATKVLVYNESYAHTWCADAEYGHANYELIDPPLAITQQPVVDSGSFSVDTTAQIEAVGEGVTYQWYYADGDDDFTAADATDALYSVLIQPGVVRRAYCVVSDTNGDTLTSNVVYMTANCVGITYSSRDTYSSIARVMSSYDLTEMDIPAYLDGKPVTTIENYVFYECDTIERITLPDSITTIGDYAFQYCESLTSIVIPDGVTTIGEYAFSDCTALTSVHLPDNLTAISSYMFFNCTSLTSITIPAGVTAIGDYAFSECHALENIIIPDNVTTIGENAFSGCAALTSVTLPDSLTSLGIFAFSYCRSLTGVTIPDGITDIGRYTFAECDALSNVVIPDSVTTIGGYAFYYCTSLTDITIPDSVTSMEKEAFSFSALTSVTIPAGVTTIDEAVFMGCSALTNVTIHDNVTKIGEMAFMYCSTLADITIPESVTSIGSNAFQAPTCLYIYTDSAAHQWCIDNSYTNFELIDAPQIPDGLAYTIADGAATITGYTGSATELVIPASIEGYPVTMIGESAFNGCRNLSNITIPDSVTSIDDWAFAYCESLASITIPDSVTTIGDSTFYHCTSLTSITIPDSVTSISSGAFQYCTLLTSITIPDGVTSIGNYAFFDCTGLASITIPDSVTTIGDSAFYHCTGLTSITLPDSLASIGNNAFETCTGLTSIIIPDSVTSIGSCVFEGCYGLTSITIQDGVTSIGSGAFQYCEFLTSITIPDSVTSIGSGAFQYCTFLTSITIPATVTTIGENAFTDTTLRIYTDSAAHQWCIDNSYTNFELIDAPQIPEGLAYTITNDEVTITGYTGTATELTIPATIEDCPVTTIAQAAFKECESLTSVVLPEGVTTIGKSAFNACSNLESVTIPSTVTAIGGYAFYSCYGLTSAVIPEGVASIGDYTFYMCTHLESIELPESIITIGAEAFWSCNLLNSISIPENVTTIGAGAFEYCQSLASVVIPATVTSVGANAFTATTLNVYADSAAHQWCLDNSYANFALIDAPQVPAGLAYTITDGAATVTDYTGSASEVVVPKYIEGYPVTTIANFAFYQSSTLTGIILPDSVTAIGNYAFGGSQRLTGVTIPEGVATIGEGAFSTCTALTDITIPDSVTALGSSMFYGCTALTDVTLSDNITEISNHTFYQCSSLAGVVIPAGVTSIGEKAFNYCGALESITIPNGVTTIGEYVFSECDLLSDVIVPNSVTSMGQRVFHGCDALSSITLSNSITTISDGTFYNCKALTGIVIPDGVTTIGRDAFHSCEALESVTIPGSVTTIGHHAFECCYVLESVTIPMGVITIGDCAFYYCSALESVNIPDSVTTIGESAFHLCGSLLGVTIPASVTSIGAEAFSTYLYVYADSPAHQWCIDNSYTNFELID